MKKIFALVLAVVLCFSIAVISPYAESTVEASTETKLKFNSDGSFKIIQVADLQDNTNHVDKTLEYIKEIAEDEKPDLFILTGDNISDSVARGYTKANSVKRVKKAIDAFMSVFEEIGVPVAVVFGNHDAEGRVSKEEQMAIYNEYNCCVAIDEGEALYGCGTYNLPVYSSDGKKIAYNLWLFDSNMYNENGEYDYVHDDQVEWYVKTAEELKNQNDGKPVPSMAFQHIIVREVFDALIQVEKGVDGAVKGDDNIYYALPEGAKGELLEIPCPGEEKSLQFEKMVEQGDVKAMFFGHDHENSFEVSHNGIDIVNTPTSGFGAYGGKNRGVRVITLDEKDTSTYETELITYLGNYCTEPFEIFLYHVQGVKYIWDMFLMGLTMPIKFITNLFA